ncbi:nucleoporin NUP145-like [Penaeus monodon]|uniref:nucleoporin NUP145-like n=1 Tax=Penaeus monodon TaxID=6687 RepID=UPI0018A70D43|nr:nucleoporin NUP145-like [Penaeus monodon]
MYGQSQSSFGDTIFSFGASYGAPNMATIRTTGFGSTVFGKDKFGNSQQTTSFKTTTSSSDGVTSSDTSLFGILQQQSATGGLSGQHQTQQSSAGFGYTTSGFGSTSNGGSGGVGGLFAQHQTQQSSAGFGYPTSGFGATSDGGGLSGQTQQPINSAGLFSRSGTSGFGLQQCATQSKPFGFGQTTTTVGAGCLFGMTQPATTGYGATGGDFTGTTVKYEPVTGMVTLTRELRIRLHVDDCLANCKSSGQGKALDGFDHTPQATNTLPQMQDFGATSDGGPYESGTGTAAFGKTSTAPATGFSSNQTTHQQKTGAFTFGTTLTSTPSLFGSTPQQQQQPSSGFSGGFQLGQNTQQQNINGGSGGLIGNQKPGFFPYQNTDTELFDRKPADTTQSMSTGCRPFGSAPNASATQNNYSIRGQRSSVYGINPHKSVWYYSRTLTVRGFNI